MNINNKKLHFIIKRIFDLIMSIFLLLFLSPLSVLIGLLIKIDSKGPVFYKHKRLGKSGKIFNCYKFRSMYNNAPQDHYEKFIKNALKNKYGQDVANNHVEFKRNDPRVTEIGKILRLTSIDELPQLINVVYGEMSLVGPRPDTLLALSKYNEIQRVRLNVLPGMTGLWQVNGRSNLKLQQMYKLDVKYVEKFSLFLDLKILLKTISAVIRCEGAG